MEKLRPNIAFAGLTAAGKTTHAKILAEQLGYKYVSATEIILDILDMANDPDSVWFTHYDEIEKEREGDKIDIELESRVRKMADSQGGLVLDTWAMAYIYKGPLIRIWIESDESSRTRKAYVSQNEKSLELNGCNLLINRKDSETREKFITRLGFDLFTDMSRYDTVVCNTDLIPLPTKASSKDGIRTFSPVIYDVAYYLVNQALKEEPENTVAEIMTKYGSMVESLNERPWSF